MSGYTPIWIDPELASRSWVTDLVRLFSPTAELKEVASGRSGHSSIPASHSHHSTPPSAPPTPDPNAAGAAAAASTGGGEESGAAPVPRSGVLTIRVVEARNLRPPAGVQLPPGIRDAVEQAQAGMARGARESIQRKQMWWLP